MLTLMLIGGIILCIAMLVLVSCALVAPDGRQDAAGFHAEGRATSSWVHPKLGDVETGSNSLHR